MKAEPEATRGAALIVTVVLLLQLSLLALLVLLNQQQQLQALAALDEKALQRSLAMRQLFDELAQQAIDMRASASQHSEQSIRLTGQYDATEVSLEYQMQVISCQHLTPEQTADTSCWSLQIAELSSGVWRQRVLHVADSDCGAYWYVAEAG